MQPGWIPEIFETCELGVSSAYEPELIPPNQLPWMKNGKIRGGKPSTRPVIEQRLILPHGNVQGVSFFSIQGGMLIMQISGRLYRVRIANDAFSVDEITLGYINSPALQFAWMQETVGSIVVQDGQSNPIIYDGSVARRSDVANNEVPKGRMMAYGNGRLWVAINDNEIVAGDIKTAVFQSELKFTETTYFSGGGAFYFPFKLNAMGFVPASGAAGYGSLMVFGKNRSESVRADIAARDLWPTYPGFIQPVLLSTGSVSQYGISEVNQDLFWRDGLGEIRSLRSSAVQDFQGPGNSAISREVSRLIDYEATHRLDACSSIHFNNRLLITASPFINIYGFTSFKNVISLDFSPLSSMRGKVPPAYDGQWEGINFTRLVQGEFNGQRRAFAVSLDPDGNNRLWEIKERGTNDTFQIGGGDTFSTVKSEIPMVIEYPRRGWGDPKRRKRLERCDVYLSDLEGDSDISVYWRADNYQKWNKWDQYDVCANTTDASIAVPHIWKNILPQERPQTMTFTIPDGINAITQRGLQTGFEFQIRLALIGKGKIHRCTVYATPIDEEQFADRGTNFDACIDNDVTGNDIPYSMNPYISNIGTSTIDYSYRAGTATIVGFSEFSAPSSPPKKYTVKTWDGRVIHCDYAKNLGGCVGPSVNSANYWWIGTASYNVVDGSRSKDTEYLLPNQDYSFLPGCPGETTTDYFISTNHPTIDYDVVLPPYPDSYVWVQSQNTPTKLWWLKTGCFTSATIDAYRQINGTARFNLTLSAEDTEDAALARLWPTSESGWSAYQPSSIACGYSLYELRGSDQFTFADIQVRFKINGIGFLPNNVLDYSVYVYRRPQGSTGAFTLYQTIVYPVIPDNLGQFTIIDFTPQVRGYQTYATPVLGGGGGAC